MGWTAGWWIAVVAVGAVALGALVAALSRWRAVLAIDAVWELLRERGGSGTFDPSLVADVPEPGRSWLCRVMARGAPLAGSVELDMAGSLTLDPDRPPMAMTARQILAPPHGFVWRARVGRGAVRIRGWDAISDGTASLRWWLWGLIPVVREDGPDVDRSAAGRLLGESVLVPSVLLPGAGARWEPLDDRRVRVTPPPPMAGERREAVPLELTFSGDGALERVRYHRWNSDPANGPVGPLPFEVRMEGERAFGGYTLPARLTAGWRPDGREGRDFFEAEIRQARFR